MKLIEKNNKEVNRFELEMEVSPEELNNAINAVYKKESKKMNIPGFRKGKASRAFIENYYGKEVFFEAAVDHIYRDIIDEAVKLSEMDVIAVTDVSIDSISNEEGIKAKISVVIKPEVEIKDYKGIEVEKEIVEVTAEEVDQDIQRVRERNSRTVEVTDRKAEDGDIAVIDYEGFIDEKPFDGGKGENHELTLGSGQFIPGFEEQIVGHSIGQDFDVNVSFPEDYHAEELKGKEAVFKTTLHEIKKKELPELDDEFVKDVSEFDTVEEYKADVEKHLREHKEEHAQGDVENQIIDEIIKKVEGDIPQEMIENEIDEQVNNFAYRLRSQGLDLETYLKYTGMTTDNLRDQHRMQAEGQVKIRLGLEKIADLENMTASEEEISEELENMSKTYNMPVENIRQIITDKGVAADIKNKKAMEFLKENAVVKEITKEEKEAKMEALMKENAERAKEEAKEQAEVEAKETAEADTDAE